jgi:hypothetical protein
VWRDRHDVPAPAAAAAEQPDVTGRSASVRPVSVPDAAERAFHASRGGPALDPGRPGASGRQTAEAAKAKSKSKNQALGHAKQEEKVKGSNGQGTPGAGRPAFADTQGPPPHASGQGSGSGQGSASGQGSGAETGSPAKGAETSQDKSSKSAKSAG